MTNVSVEEYEGQDIVYGAPAEEDEIQAWEQRQATKGAATEVSACKAKPAFKLCDLLVEPSTSEVISADDNDEDEYVIDGIHLDDEQIEAVERILEFVDNREQRAESRSIILTGRAGSGKSTVVKYLRKVMRHRLQLMATTGMAAVGIGASTIDKIFCIQRGDDKRAWKIWSPSYLAYLMTKIYGGVELFLCDEASMIGRKMGDLTYNILCEHDKLLLLVGDWSQAKPVKDAWPEASPLFSHAKRICLTKCHRQGDRIFLDALEEVRNGQPGEIAEILFEACVRPPREIDVRLLASNKEVDGVNQQRLNRHCADTGSEKFTFSKETRVSDLRKPEKQEKAPMTIAMRERLIENSRLANTYHEFAEQCRIMISVNSIKEYDTREEGQDEHSHYPRYVNGDTGILEELQRGANGEITGLHIRLDRTKHSVYVGLRSIVVKSAADEDEFSISGFPVRLAYALTIHKSQGATLPSAWVSLSSIRCFPPEDRHGLAYVALSRVRAAPDDLGIDAWVPDVVYCDPVALQLVSVNSGKDDGVAGCDQP